MMKVPFENLDIHRGRPIVLEDRSLFAKIVERRRGGFCYELNGLFAWLLRELGFEVSMLSGEVAQPGGGYGPPFDHMALRVRLEEEWLADVGFGDSFIEPLPLGFDGEVMEDDFAYRIVVVGEQHGVLRREIGRDDEADWQPQYRFTLDPHVYGDYEEMSQFHQTSPLSGFTRKEVCSRATERGRVTVSDRRLIEIEGGTRNERMLSTEEEFRRTLSDRFGISLDA
jgi:N-hydroxyarylamine O-acetyltransferase